ncbi:Protein N-acetyltransferase, RimJ/RimL family [Vibrio xiamenensis]|uniref:Protein N-acetyltransferase, RimJ/RimL family n=1 Tax=Vibrio xiamenensis TaxID=861298 RepID=A0A1G8DHZ8_9VIBR|nr:GNAT family N-acetyltransferase [Vibrio xiamenensis]SDH57293.1 Protein N-acetyltransferase, RimJ/RimL family [Vibrio xiamenensis]
MELRAFEKDDYALLIDWIDSDQLNYLWGGPTFQFPLDYDQINQHCLKAEVLPFVCVVDGKNAGYIELFKVADGHYRICRVFVANDFRGRGVSKPMLKQLMELAKTQYSAHLLSLAVFAHNDVAKHCYQSLGFEVTSEEAGTRSFAGQAWRLLKMEKSV